MFTDQQKSMIEDCIRLGAGTASFAISVKEQGWCSEKQFLTMQKLKAWREYLALGNGKHTRNSSRNRDIWFADYGNGGEF